MLIQAWQKYYSPKFCSGYWDVLNELGIQGRIFLPEEISEEITKTDDELSEWLKSSKIPVRKTDENVVNCWKKILDKNPIHKYLVDNTKQRSLADPWIIAHAINESATVVTKEERLMAPNSNRIKIPNVCDNMEVYCINDFQFIQDLNIQFTCKLK